MKKLLVLLFSILISFNSYGEWKEIGSSDEGDTFFVDIDTIKENGMYVYWWDMNNYFKPDKWGDKSSAIYSQGDCGANRSMMLSGIFYEQPMGEGSNEQYTPPNPEWSYPFPGTITANLLDYVCDYVD